MNKAQVGHLFVLLHMEQASHSRPVGTRQHMTLRVCQCPVKQCKLLCMAHIKYPRIQHGWVHLQALRMPHQCIAQVKVPHMDLCPHPVKMLFILQLSLGMIGKIGSQLGHRLVFILEHPLVFTP